MITDEHFHVLQREFEQHERQARLNGTPEEREHHTRTAVLLLEVHAALLARETGRQIAGQRKV